MPRRPADAAALPPPDPCTAVPAQLHAELLRFWEEFQEVAVEQGVQIPSQPDFVRCLGRVWAASPFVARSMARDPALLRELLDSGDLLTDSAPGELLARVHRAVAACGNEHELKSVLRAVRLREMLRIAWRDLAGWAHLDETLHDLSDLADACVDGALQLLHDWQCQEWGAPRTTRGAAQQLVVLGMGKLGARELNFSSDIDLIFAFPEPGETDRRRRSNEEFFTRLGQSLIQILSVADRDGQVFRVDMRLRPYGDSGPLVMSFDAMEEYYQLQGREWERYAMIKARVIAGDQHAGAELMKRLKPFVFRRYLDYGAFASLREMKAMISRELARKGMADNIKLGPGGIREIEFIGQAFQLIRGGREPALQQRGILAILVELCVLDHLPCYATETLSEAYVFLRRLENHLQAIDDTQVHTLPEDGATRARLALGMGYTNWEVLAKRLAKHRQQVQQHFDQVFAAPQVAEQGEPAADDVMTAVWAGTLEGAEAVLALRHAGYQEPDEALRRLHQLHEGLRYRALGTQGRLRLKRLMPMLLTAVATAERPDATLARLSALIETIAGRTAYLSLLEENPLALSQLVRLSDASPWISAQLARHPLLFDELLDPRTLYAPLDRAALVNELRVRLANVADDDLEAQMEALRQFKQANVLRVAAADVAQVMPLMVVSDHLTEVAEVVLAEVLALALAHLARRHGLPRTRNDSGGFAIVGYGKLGGIELGYGSDLDLVFLHDGGEGRTDGPKPLPNDVFYARLGQRIIHMLNTLTPGGVLYEVDMRLRPSGASGLLVSSVEAFADYQRKEAWTWEHQALVRARPVAGDARIAKAFAAVRAEVLGRAREPAVLRGEVRDMRTRMREELSAGKPGQFDIKQDAGGIADIEFMVQYGILQWAHSFPALLQYTDNIRLLQGLVDCGRLKAADRQLLADAYRAYRARVHALTLQEEPAVADEAEFRAEREGVVGIWRKLLEVQ